MWIEILQVIFNATMIGIGTAIGNYIATTHLIKKLGKVKKVGGKM
jgi:hypothetical protein